MFDSDYWGERLKVLEEALNCSLFLVGGVVRDALLNRSTKDIDLVVEGDSLAIAGRWADLCEGSLVALDSERGIYRVVEKGGTWLDFCAMVGQNLEQDLKARDLTVNAIAWGRERGWVDPLGGLQDLEAGRLRACSDTTFDDDPLRLLRWPRLAAATGLQPEEGLTAVTRKKAHLLPNCSGERIREELFALLAGPAAGWLPRLEDLGLLFQVMPELEPCRGCTQNHYHHLDVLDHTFEVVNGLEEAYLDGFTELNDERLSEFMDQRLTADRNRFTLLKMAALLHDVGKPETRWVQYDGRIRFPGHAAKGVPLAEQVADRLRLSNKEKHFLTSLVRDHMEPVLLPSRGADDLKVHRFLRDTDPYGLELVVLSRADVLATRGPVQTEFQLERHRLFAELAVAQILDRGQLYRPEMPLGGQDLIRLGLKPGPLIGQVLRRLGEEVVRRQGRMSTKEAIHWVTLFYLDS